MVKEKTTKNKKAPVKKREAVARAKELEVEMPKEPVEVELEMAEKMDEAGGAEKRSKKYFEAVGRRKTAIARVRLLTIKPFEGDEGKITVNEKFYKEYFPTLTLQQSAEAALRRLKSLNRFEVVARVKGGGINAQSEALRHGLARALVLFNADFRKKLKKAGYMKRDPRAKERRKYGLKKARRAPQWAKR